MLRAGNDYLTAIRDGRKIYIGSELVRDVTTHPAFRNAARSFATFTTGSVQARTSKPPATGKMGSDIPGGI